MQVTLSPRKCRLGDPTPRLTPDAMSQNKIKVPEDQHCLGFSLNFYSVKDRFSPLGLDVGNKLGCTGKLLRGQLMPGDSLSL